MQSSSTLKKSENHRAADYIARFRPRSKLHSPQNAVYGLNMFEDRFIDQCSLNKLPEFSMGDRFNVWWPCWQGHDKRNYKKPASMTTSKTWKPDSNLTAIFESLTFWNAFLQVFQVFLQTCSARIKGNCCFQLSSFETDFGNRKRRTNQTLSTSKIYLCLKWGSHSLCPSDGLASPGLDARVSSTKSNLWPEKVESKKYQNPSKKIHPNSFRSLRSPAPRNASLFAFLEVHFLLPPDGRATIDQRRKGTGHEHLWTFDFLILNFANELLSNHTVSLFDPGNCHLVKLKLASTSYSLCLQLFLCGIQLLQKPRNNCCMVVSKKSVA